MKKLSMILAAVGFVFMAKAENLNSKFDNILSGYTQLDKQATKDIYSFYLNEYNQYEAHYSFDDFQTNLQSIINHNKDNSHSYKKGLNQFTGMNLEKVYKQKAAPTCPETGYILTSSSLSPSQYDWRQSIMASPVREQGFEGNQVAYQVASAFDFYYQNKYKVQKNFSPQQLIDCVPQATTPTDAYEYIIYAGGLANIQDYPRASYGSSSSQCYFNYSMDGIQVLGSNGTGTYRTPSNDENTLQSIVATVGPVTTLFNVNPDFLTYTSGVFTSTSCSQSSSFTATLLIIGYGEDNGQKYWLIQNSWGSSWGEQGYARVVKGSNICGIASCGTLPVSVFDGEHEPVRKFQLYLHNTTETEAFCQDGTPSGVYFSKGYGDGKKKTIFHFEGGAWCTGRDENSILADCYERSKNNIGSSKGWEITTDKEWYFSGNKTVDILFYNWNRFYFPYCDGSGHQGYLKEPKVYNNTNLYFKGYNNTIAHLNFLFKLMPIEQLDTFVVNGCSAGGLAVYTWVDYVQNLITQKNKNVKFFGLPDSGFFLDYKNAQTNDNDYTIKMKALYNLVNAEEPFPNTNCTASNPTDPASCFMPQIGVKYLTSPLFMIESLYDAWQVPNILGLGCTGGTALTNCNDTEKTEINAFKAETSNQLKTAASAASNRAVWGPSCLFHCYSHYGTDEQYGTHIQVPENSGNTLGASILQFMMGIKGSENWQFIDSVDWPGNGPCSNQQLEMTCPQIIAKKKQQFLTQ